MSSTASINDTQWQAINILVNRMKYYPLVQAICRSGAAWNEFDLGKFSNFNSQITAAVLAPSIGAGYFFVFLIMQPNALRLLFDILKNPMILCVYTKEMMTASITSLKTDSNTGESYNDGKAPYRMNEDELSQIIDERNEFRSTGPSLHSQHSITQSDVSSNPLVNDNL
eukprot:gene8578-11591_t